MLITIIFLISCISTARILEKKKMNVAAAAYSVLFVVIFSALLLTADSELIGNALSNIMGVKSYMLTRDALIYVLHSAGYGACIYAALFVTLIFQVAALLAITVVTLFRKRTATIISKKDNYRCPHTPRALYLNNSINLLYCRMLN